MRRKATTANTEAALWAGRRLLVRIAIFVPTLAGALSLVFSVASTTASAGVGQTSLPDGRVWEQVSPVDKGHNDISPRGLAAAADGSRIAFKSRGSFAGQETSHGFLLTDYVSVRTPSSWRTEGITPPHGLLNFQTGYVAFTEDLDKGLLEQADSAEAPLVPGAFSGVNLYLRDLATRTYGLLNGAAGSLGSGGGVDGASADFSHVLFESPSHLTSDSPCHASANICVYEWENGTLRLASIKPDGTPTTGVGGAGAEHNIPLGSLEHAMSADGTRYYFTSDREIFMRENHATTLPVSAPELTSPPGGFQPSSAFQAGEAAHGEKAIFTTFAPKVDADTNETNDLYLWDRNKPIGHRLTFLSDDRNPATPDGASVNSPRENWGGVLGSSDDLRRVYFIADNQIVAGQPETAGPKLFLWDDTGIEPTVAYIATLSPDDDEGWEGPLVTPLYTKPAQVSKDGNRVVFISHTDLTGYESHGEAQIYLYEAAGNHLECVSCSANAFPSDGFIGFNAKLNFGSNAIPTNRQPRNLAEGGRVFFETSRGLLAQDSNGKIDVYEFEQGQLHLISAGTGNNDSHFAEADTSGDNVFFTTSDRLVGWDNDENVDLYDARVGGGLPEPPPAPPACEGDACQPPPVLPNDPTPASTGYQGRGNLSPKQRKSRKRRARHRHVRHAGHKKHHDNSTRRHG